MKIYVASSWRNEYQPNVVDLLRSLGHEVYDFRNPKNKKGFAWSDIHVLWENWTTQEYIEALNHPIAERGFKSDFDAMKWADCCVMVLPCGRSANTEAGWMKGAGKEVFVFQPIPQEPELMYKIYDGLLSSYDQLRNLFYNRESANQEPKSTDVNLIPKYKHLHLEREKWLKDTTAAIIHVKIPLNKKLIIWIDERGEILHHDALLVDLKSRFVDKKRLKVGDFLFITKGNEWKEYRGMVVLEIFECNLPKEAQS